MLDRAPESCQKLNCSSIWVRDWPGEPNRVAFRGIRFVKIELQRGWLRCEAGQRQQISVNKVRTELCNEFVHYYANTSVNYKKRSQPRRIFFFTYLLYISYYSYGYYNFYKFNCHHQHIHVRYQGARGVQVKLGPAIEISHVFKTVYP